MTCPIIPDSKKNWKSYILYGICDGNDKYIYTESLYKQLRLHEFNVFVLGKSGQ